jgi:hypothetical protein
MGLSGVGDSETEEGMVEPPVKMILNGGWWERSVVFSMGKSV